MVITLVTDTFAGDNNGTTVAAKSLAHELMRDGHTVRILACGDPAQDGVDPETHLDMYHVPELRVPIASRLAHRQGTLFGKPVRDTITRAVTGADVVHVFQPWPLGARARSIAHKLHVPAIAAFHIQPENITYNIGLGWFPPAAWLVYHLLHVLFYRRFEHIHCPSTFIAAQLRKHGYRAELHVISNGVRPEFFASGGTPKPSDGVFRILMGGRLSKEKRQDVLIEAANLSRHRDQLQLYFAGRGPKRKTYEALSGKLPRKPVFRYYDQPQLLELIRRCDLYVHTSDIEIEGLSCMEAFSAGLVPVIADSARSATPQFSLCEESLFRAGDAHDLADHIDFWIEHADKRAEMGPVYAHEGHRFSLEHSVRAMERVYRMAAGPRPVERPHTSVFNVGTRLLYTVIVIPLLFCWLTIVNGARIHGIGNLRGLRGAVTVCNHVHLLDSVMVALASWPRKPIFTTIHKNVDTLFPGFLVNLLGGVPLPCEKKNLDDFFQEMELSLTNGSIVHMFPEGELIPWDTHIRDFKRGAFHLAARTRAPIVPMAISFPPARGPRALLTKKPTMTLTVGKPVYPLATDVLHDEHDRMALIRAAVVSMSEDGKPV